MVPSCACNIDLSLRTARLTMLLQDAERAALDGAREEESRRLARERRVLDKQSKALLKLPNKKERTAVEAIEAVLEKERADCRAMQARHKLTVERLRCQVKSLQVR